MPQIRLQLKPGGPDCDHVLVSNLAGRVLKVLSIPQLRESIRDFEDPLVAQIKRVVRDSGLTDPAQIKTFLESRDLDY